MKIFKIIGSFGDGLMDKKYGLYEVLIEGPDEETKEDFQKKVCKITEELKNKYDAGNKEVPYEKRKSRKEIINEIANSLCKRFGYTLISIEEKYVSIEEKYESTEGEYVISGFVK